MLREQIGQRVLRGSALAGGVDGLSVQRGNVRYRLAALFHDIQHTQCAGGQQHHAALRLVVQDGRHVGRHRQHIQLALHQLGRQLIGAGRDGEFVPVLRGAALRVIQQLYHAHGGRALQPAQPHSDRLGGGFVAILNGHRRFRRYAGAQRQCQRQRQQQGYHFFHVVFSFP